MEGMGAGDQANAATGATAAAGAAGVQGLVQAVDRGAESQSKEFSKWMDWRFQFPTFVGGVEPGMLTLMKQAEREETAINDAGSNVRPQSERLYSYIFVADRVDEADDLLPVGVEEGG